MREVVLRAPKASTDRPRFLNWLKELDKAAAGLPVANDWIDYPFFMFIRYPRLQPDVPTRDAEFAYILRSTTRLESEIANHEEAKRALKGLKVSQRPQLAALVLALSGDVIAYKLYNTRRKKRRR